jgi:hypothetical protein
VNEPSLFDPVTEPEPVGSLSRVAHFAEEARQGRLAALVALAMAEAEVEAFLEQQRRTAAAHDAVVRESREGRVVANPRSTSAKAARDIAPKVGSQRARILAAVVEHGGLTDHELSERLELLDNSVRPRRSELIEGGYLQDSGRVRQHRGSQWSIWEATESGYAWYRAQQLGGVA